MYRRATSCSAACVAQVTVVAGCVYAAVLSLMRRPIPSMQCRVAAGPAILTGALWSLGNFLSIYAVEYLGLSLGWPLVQCQLIISSLWCAAGASAGSPGCPAVQLLLMDVPRGHCGTLPFRMRVVTELHAVRLALLGILTRWM